MRFPTIRDFQGPMYKPRLSQRLQVRKSHHMPPGSQRSPFKNHHSRRRIRLRLADRHRTAFSWSEGECGTEVLCSCGLLAVHSDLTQKLKPGCLRLRRGHGPSQSKFTLLCLKERAVWVYHRDLLFQLI
jgi:hypothetical protein